MLHNMWMDCLLLWRAACQMMSDMLGTLFDVCHWAYEHPLLAVLIVVCLYVIHRRVQKAERVFLTKQTRRS